ncbi:hypothetical protein BKA62DRAFT_797832 [Auriculariales sp. MPI-PUGE-AT-0066]|nr:hypothetical protein BKA62DRAFT_797832 [Auriculariales sp. MPI-PUGE-AT-0066]
MPSNASNLSHKPCMSSLPVEILIPVFQNFSDLQTLHAAILACKLFHDVFNGHQSAICRAVIVNRLGHEDVLIPALRELRTAMYYRGEIPPTTFARTLGAISERSVAAGALEPSWTETKLLFGRANVLDVLEVCFSRSQKDRQTLTTSRLEPQESTRFKIAMLRAWVLHHAFKHMDVRARQRNWFSQDDEPFIARKTAIYDEFSVSDLHDIGTVLVWAGNYAQPPRGGFSRHMNWLLVVHGPAVYAQRCVAVDRQWQLSIDHKPNMMGSDENFFWYYDAKKIWHERGVEYDDTDGIIVAPIGVRSLVEPLGADDTCTECHAVVGLDLWNESNWPYLADHLNFWCPKELYGIRLPGRLGYNVSEYTLVRLYIDNPTRTDLSMVTTNEHDYELFNRCPYGVQGEPEAPGGPIPIPRILRELFELPEEVTEPTLKAYMQCEEPYVFKNTLPGDWFCCDCLYGLVMGRFWIWWYHQRASGKVHGRPLLEKNCPAGFDCNRQREEDHIAVMNVKFYQHLCIPTTSNDQQYDAISVHLDPYVFAGRHVRVGML